VKSRDSARATECTHSSGEMSGGPRAILGDDLAKQTKT
jgi:hypothetical protein